MKVSEIIANVNNLRPNLYGDDIKIRWLATLDGQIFNELIINFHPEKDALCGELIRPELPVVRDFVPPKDIDDELLVPFPHGDDVYTAYLLAMIDKANGEVEKYNQSITAYAAAYKQYQAWYIRTHRPIETGPFRF